MNASQTYFISGTDTDCGKTIITGLLARSLIKQGRSVITQKLVQTGSSGIADDILIHRKIMGMNLQPADLQNHTCSYVFKHPASPHLAANMENNVIEPEVIRKATAILSGNYDIILLEGAGGLFVPLQKEYYTIDYIMEYGYPLLFVSNSRLGSINHTIMSLELCRRRNVCVDAFFYNHYPNSDRNILEDSRKIFKEYLQKYHPNTLFFDVPRLSDPCHGNLTFEGFPTEK